MPRLGYDEYFARSSDSKSLDLKKIIKPVIIIAIVAIIAFSGNYFYRKYRSNKVQAEEGLHPINSLFVDGQLSVYRFKKSQWEKASEVFKIYRKDWLVTGAIPRTVMKLDGDSNIRISPMSEVVYLSYEDGIYSFQLSQGKIFIEGFEGKYMVSTPLGSIYSQDSKVLVEYQENGKMKVFCFSGKVSVLPVKENSRSILIKAGDKIYIDKKYNISSSSKIEKSKIDKWALWNLSFSGKGMKVGQKPPPYYFVAKKKDIKVVFRHTEKRLEKMRKIQEEKVESIKDHKPDNYPRFNPDKKRYVTRKKTVKKTSKPPKIGDEDYKKATNKGKIPQNEHEADSRDLIEVENVNTFDYEGLEREEMVRKHKGAFYYLDNTKRQKDNPATVPGLPIGSEPVGPRGKT